MLCPVLDSHCKDVDALGCAQWRWCVGVCDDEWGGAERRRLVWCEEDEEARFCCCLQALGRVQRNQSNSSMCMVIGQEAMGPSFNKANSAYMPGKWKGRTNRHYMSISVAGDIPWATCWAAVFKLTLCWAGSWTSYLNRLLWICITLWFLFN